MTAAGTLGLIGAALAGRCAGRGCAKVDISAAIKEAFPKAGLEHQLRARAEGHWDPPHFFDEAGAAVAEAAYQHIAAFGAAGKAD